jgi:hypothetical protein
MTYSSHSSQRLIISDDKAFFTARNRIRQDLDYLEETIISLREVLNDNMILYENPIRFFDLVREFRHRIRTVDMPPELSFMISSKINSKPSSPSRTYPPGSFQYLESLLIENAS